ncbi:hypothetical protein [Sessilibacter sp. MAH4]
MMQEVYCEVVGRSVGLIKKKIEINVDFGESIGWIERLTGGNPMKDSFGKIIQFNSMIDALNHMAKDGWLFVNAYSITLKDQNVYHYIMRKVIS